MDSKTVKRSGVEYQDAAQVPIRVPKAEIEAFGARVAEWIGHKPGQPVQSAIKQIGGVIEFRDTSESPDGGYILVHGPRDFGIVLSTWTSPRRDQFTLAHELGHYALHSRFGEVRLFAARTGCGQSEWEANWFAAGFLMPEFEFRAAAEQSPSIPFLAARFGVSAAAAEIRMKTLGLAVK